MEKVVNDLGEELKAFVFIDFFEADMRALAGSMPRVLRMIIGCTCSEEVAVDANAARTLSRA